MSGLRVQCGDPRRREQFVGASTRASPRGGIRHLPCMIAAMYKCVCKVLVGVSPWRLENLTRIIFRIRIRQGQFCRLVHTPSVRVVSLESIFPSNLVDRDTFGKLHSWQLQHSTVYMSMQYGVMDLFSMIQQSPADAHYSFFQ